jgi:hypothetical protein
MLIQSAEFDAEFDKGILFKNLQTTMFFRREQKLPSVAVQRVRVLKTFILCGTFCIKILATSVDTVKIFASVGSTQ